MAQARADNSTLRSCGARQFRLDDCGLQVIAPLSEVACKNRKSYDAALRLASQHTLKDGRKFGMLSLTSITPGAADRLYAKLKERPDGGERVRTAVLCVTVCKRAWNIARRDKPNIVRQNGTYL